MRGQSLYFILLLFLVSVTEIQYAADSHAGGKDHGNTKFGNNESEVLFKIRSMGVDAAHYIDNDDTEKADSTYREAIRLAEGTFEVMTILPAYIQYLNENNIRQDRKMVEHIIEKSRDLINSSTNDQLVFDTYSAVTRTWIRLGDGENSQTWAMKLLSLCTAESNLKNKSTAFILAGKSMELLGRKENAYENYLKAQELIAQIHDGQEEALSYDLNGALFEFYMKINQFDKAAEHKTLQINYASRVMKDSSQVLWLSLDLCRLRLSEDKEDNIIPNLEEIIKYSENHHQERMLHAALSIYRSILLNTQDLKGFHELFVERYPENLEMIREELPALYFLISAYLQENSGRIDSADYFFELADTEVAKIGNDIYSSNFYKRYGEYLIRNGRKEEALEKFRLSFDMAKKQDYLDYMLEASAYVEDLSAELSNYQLAYEYGKIHNELDIRKTMAMHEDDMLKMELLSQARQMEYIAEKNDLERKRKFNLQYAIIVVTIMCLFLLLILASSLTVPEWLIEMLGFFTILFLFEFIILLLDNKLHHITHGAPLKIFLIKISILAFLFPLHHLIETKITNYMKKNKMITSLSKETIIDTIGDLWPWLKRKSGVGSGGH